MNVLLEASRACLLCWTDISSSSDKGNWSSVPLSICACLWVSVKMWGEGVRLNKGVWASLSVSVIVCEPRNMALIACCLSYVMSKPLNDINITQSLFTSLLQSVPVFRVRGCCTWRQLSSPAAPQETDHSSPRCYPPALQERQKQRETNRGARRGEGTGGGRGGAGGAGETGGEMQRF